MNFQFNINSPTKVTERVKQLLNKFDKINYELVLIPVRTEEESVVGDCYQNVKNKIKKDGGFIRYGWSVYDNGFFIEAEKHAIWESCGQLVCISPNLEYISQIMFIMDDIDEGIDVPNIRCNYSGLQVIDDFFLLVDIKNQLLIEYGIPLDDRNVNLHPALRESYDRLVEKFIPSFQIYILSNTHETCICGKNSTYDNCHSKHFISDVINEINSKIIQYDLRANK